MKKLFYLLLLVVGVVGSAAGAFAADLPSVSCDTYGTDANSCDQCFDGGSKYQGQQFFLGDDFIAGDRDRLLFWDENPIDQIPVVNNLNGNTSWFVSDNLTQYVGTYNTSGGRELFWFKAGTRTNFLATRSGGFMQLQNVSTDNVDPNKPALRVDVVTNTRDYVNNTISDTLRSHKECFFYSPSYCGDGVVDGSDGEVCDPSDTTESGWGNGGCDTNTCQPIETPTCNGITVSPVSGTNPLTSSVVCEGYKVNTFKIDCGNGQVFTGNGSGNGTEQFERTCTYTEAEVYTPTCTVNNTITNPSCEGTVRVINPVPSITIDKVDANSADLDGNVGNDTQTVNSGDSAVFKITVTNTGAEGLVNVEVKDPNADSCILLAGPALAKIQAVGNRDNIFDVGESFSYICSKAGTTADYVNTAFVTGQGDISGSVVDDSDPTTILVAKDYDLALVKVVSGNQTVFAPGDVITYAITVYNQGDIDANNVEVTDYIPTGFTLQDSAWDASGNTAIRTIASIPAGSNQTVTIDLRVGNNVSGSVINWAEISSDDGDDCDSTPDSSQPNDVFSGDNNIGNGCNPGGDEDDHDPATVTISNAQISIDKTDANADDLDGIVGTNDRQTVAQGDTAVFKITVTNTGTDDLNNIVLTDARALACGGSVTLPSTYPNTWSNFTTTATGNVLKPGESFSYTCSKAGTTANYTNIATVNADSTVTGNPVPEVSDPTQVLVELPYDLALTKRVTSTSGTNFTPGDLVTFTISVINQGSVDANRVVITDYIPSALELADDSWTLSGSNATRNVGMIRAGDTEQFTINLRVRENATSGTVINWAEISEDDGNDRDSTPDSDNNNDCHGTAPSDRTSIDTNADDDVDGTGDANNNGTCDTGEDEDDHDPAVITINTPVFDLALTKRVVGSTTSFSTGDIIPFAITVINQGSVDATNVQVTDYIPATLELADNNWTLSGTNAIRTIANLPANTPVTLALNLRVRENAATGDTINWAEISSADGGVDRDSTPDSDNNNDCHGTAPSDRTAIDANADDDVNGSGDANNNGTCDAGEDEDDHDPALVTIVPGVFDLALTKSVTGTTTSFAPGDTLTYDITVTNQGDIDATNIVVTDYVPAGMTTTVTTGTTFTLNIASLAAGQSTTITTPVFTIAANATSENTVNFAEISSADGGDDCDSTPDTTNGNGSGETASTGMIDDDIGNGCNPGGDEDDHDPAFITIVIPNPVPSVLIDKTDANSADLDGNVGNDTQTVAAGATATFKITVTNNGTEDLKNVSVSDTIAPLCGLTQAQATAKIQAIGNGDTIFNVGESFNYTCSRAGSTSDYTNSATVTAVGVDSDTSVTDTDTTPVIVNRGTSSSSGGGSSGGGGTYTCAGITVSGNTVTCTGNSRVRSYRLDCGNGSPLQYAANNARTSSEIFTCNYDVDNGGAVATGPAICSVDDGTTADVNSAWRTRFQCSTDVPMPVPVCGDGILQPANGEQCERQINSDGTLGDFPSICTSTCRLNIPTSSSSSSGGPTITIPNQGEINFYPQGKIIIGNAMNAIREFGDVKPTPTIVNNSDYDLNFDELCIVKKETSKTSLKGQNVQCKSMGGIFYPGEEISFSDGQINQYTGDTSKIPAGDKYEDNTLVTTIRHEGTLYTDAYFAADLEVRVTKPTIVTVGGGTSFVANTKDISDTNKLATDADSDGNVFVDTTNRNFEGVSISNTTNGTALSSNNSESEITDDLVSGKIEAEQNEYKNTVQDKVVDAGSSNHKTLGDTLDPYNGINNVYIVDGNLTVNDGDLRTELTAPTTYVINGDLIINDDIESKQNIAFVVRGGEIIVKSTVNTLDGTYISINGTIGGETSDEKLVVNGSLYGDINPLVNSRQYIKTEADGSIGVGTVVNFGSSIFKKPAPLVGQFVGEYLDSKKVAN